MSTGPSSDGSVLSFPVYQAGGLGEWIEGTLSPKVPISGQLASSGALAHVRAVAGRAGSICSNGNFWCKSSHMPIPHYWNPSRSSGFWMPQRPWASPRPSGGAHYVASRAACRGDRGSGVAGHRPRGRYPAGPPRQGRQGRTVLLHPDLAILFANWPASYGPRDIVVGLTRKTVLQHLRAGIEHAGLDEESPGTRRQRAGAHSLQHSAARHWLTTAGIPLNVVSQWLGHATPEVTLRTYRPIVGSTHSMANVP